MNVLLKAILKELSDLSALGVDIAGKQAAAVILSALLEAGKDVPGIVSNVGDFKVELDALLSNPAADADLLAYATSVVAGDSVKAMAIVSASAKLALDMASDISALVAAFKA